MSTETEALRAQIASTKAAVSAATTLIQALSKPAIDPAEVAAATADLKTATDSLLSTVAAHAPTTVSPPVTAPTGA